MKFSKHQTNCCSHPIYYRPSRKQPASSGYSLGCYCAAFLLLIWLAGCALYRQPQDPLAEWHIYLGGIPPQITGDYQEYINKLPTRERQFVNGETFYKDDAGRFAVKIEIPVYGTWKDHILIYDNANKRVKVIRYNAGHYMS
jgi:hypothetical protein